jgi:haloalkane dehalogenase
MPVLAWTRELPIAGELPDVTAIVEDYAEWLSTSPIPELFIDADPGGFLVGGPRAFSRTWPNQETVTVKGFPLLQEEAPDEYSEALARFAATISCRSVGITPSQPRSSGRNFRSRGTNSADTVPEFWPE